ncbi:phage tail protein [Rhodoplanes roseus]|uniref:Phage tail protein n=2 Tax=Rhodoplanes roseus TaxID=29409 RepID=A0A327KZH6_9BRAD|nr:phage tail protein [Rhodoplanes roseus]
MAECPCFDETDRKARKTSEGLLEMQINAKAFSSAMSSALASAVTGGKQLDDVLKSLALRLSDMTLKAALTPLTNAIATDISKLVGGSSGGSAGSSSGGLSSLLGLAAATGAIKPFAAGGVIGTPTYFPLAAGGLGLAGETGPEAIVPLARGSDGRLGVAGGGAGPTRVTINIAAQDAASFRGSEVYLTGQIARAVARGRRGL